jgi:pimeloyl-ACP methyl ester carboxylesterase
MLFKKSHLPMAIQAGRQIISAFLIYFFCLGVAPVGAVEATSSILPPVISERYSRDPVFNSNTYIWEAGKQNRRTLVLVHGVGDEASLIWRDLIELLAPRFHVIAFDLPGFGRSEKTKTIYSPERYGQFLNWIIRENATEPVILLGHSLGGTLALRYATTYPETVEQLIVVDAAAILHRIAISKNFIRFEEPDPRQKGLNGLLQKPFEKPLHALNYLAGKTVENLEFPISDQGIDALVGNDGLRDLVLGGNSQAIASLALVQEDLTGHIAAIKVPTSLIWGGADEIAPLRTGTLLAGKLAASRLRIIAKAGHVPMKEQPGEFRRLLLEEIDSPPVKADRQEPEAGPLQTGHCERQSDLVFSGNFDKITINGCRRVLVKNVSARFIGISRSEVTLENTVIEGGEIALELQRAKIIGTNVRFAGETAIQASGSRLDLAGAELKGGKAAVTTPDKAVVLFSVSTADSPLTKGNLHGVYRLGAGKGL